MFTSQGQKNHFLSVSVYFRVSTSPGCVFAFALRFPVLHFSEFQLVKALRRLKAALFFRLSKNAC